MNTKGSTHCFPARQLIPVANWLFRGRPGLRVLVIDGPRVRSKICCENLEDGRVSFPHVHIPIDPKAVIDIFALTASPDGAFTAPTQRALCRTNGHWPVNRQATVPTPFPARVNTHCLPKLRRLRRREVTRLGNDIANDKGQRQHQSDHHNHFVTVNHD